MATKEYLVELNEAIKQVSKASSAFFTTDSRSMFEKTDVNGARTCDLFKALKSGSPGDDGNEAIGWNFTKFLVGRDGNVIQRFGPQTTPEEVGKTLAALLAAQ